VPAELGEERVEEEQAVGNGVAEEEGEGALGA
jgi:hypothetical protein